MILILVPFRTLRNHQLQKQETRRTLFVSHSEAALSNKKRGQNRQKTSDVSYGRPQRWDIENAIPKT